MDFFNNLTQTQKILLGVSILALVIVIVVVIYRSRRSTVQSATAAIVSKPQQAASENTAPAVEKSAYQTYNSTAQPKEAVLALFFAPWCGHCKRLEPAWDEFMGNFDGYKGVQIVKINGDENPDLAQLHNVRGFPTIKFCPRGVRNPEGIVYDGDRSISSIADFLQRNA